MAKKNDFCLPPRVVKLGPLPPAALTTRERLFPVLVGLTLLVAGIIAAWIVLPYIKDDLFGKTTVFRDVSGNVYKYHYDRDLPTVIITILACLFLGVLMAFFVGAALDWSRGSARQRRNLDFAAAVQPVLDGISQEMQSYRFNLAELRRVERNRYQLVIGPSYFSGCLWPTVEASCLSVKTAETLGAWLMFESVAAKLPNLNRLKDGAEVTVKVPWPSKAVAYVDDPNDSRTWPYSTLLEPGQTPAYQ